MCCEAGRLESSHSPARPIWSVGGTFGGSLSPCLGARGVVCEERALRLTELSDAEELFLTNRIVGVQPVSRVDGEAGELLWRSSTVGGQLTWPLAEAYALAETAECGEG